VTGKKQKNAHSNKLIWHKIQNKIRYILPEKILLCNLTCDKLRTFQRAWEPEEGCSEDNIARNLTEMAFGFGSRAAVIRGPSIGTSATDRGNQELRTSGTGHRQRGPR
jgi:hypothetical protein